jgi:hypothetical protein
MTNDRVSGCMIGRGALYKPWLFTEIKEQRDWDISSMERFEILKKFTNYGLEMWGCDSQGVETTRKFLLEWLSFLYRYVPIGLLEDTRQQINSRPPAYFGRNQLETLMASHRCSDWIKIRLVFIFYKKKYSLIAFLFQAKCFLVKYALVIIFSPIIWRIHIRPI